jgi:hypothetical protein
MIVIVVGLILLAIRLTFAQYTPLLPGLTFYHEFLYSEGQLPPPTGCFNICKGTSQKLICGSNDKIFGQSCYFICTGDFYNNCGLR